MNLIDQSCKNKLIKLDSLISKKKIFYTVVIQDRSDIKGLLFIEQNNNIFLKQIPKDIKKKNIQNIKCLCNGDILIQINDRLIQSISDIESFFSNKSELDNKSIELSFIKIKLYNKIFNKINTNSDKKIIMQQFLKSQLHNEIYIKNINALKIQNWFRVLLSNKQKFLDYCNIIYKLSEKFVNNTINTSINHYKNSLRLVHLLKKLYFSKLITNKIKLEERIEKLEEINQIHTCALSTIEEDFDEEIFRIQMRNKIKEVSLYYEYNKKKLLADKEFENILNDNEFDYMKRIKLKNVELLKNGIQIQDKPQKKYYIFKYNNNCIEIINCKNNKKNNYLYDHIKLSFNNSIMNIVSNNNTLEFYVNKIYKDIIMNVL